MLSRFLTHALLAILFALCVNLTLIRASAGLTLPSHAVPVSVADGGDPGYPPAPH